MLKKGQRAPDFLLQTLEGTEKTLSEILADGPVLLAFFKVTCPVCQYTFPFLDRLHAASPPGALQWYGISQDNLVVTRRFLREYSVSFPTLLDTYASGYKVSNAYGIRAVPAAFLVEQDGQISLAMEGFEKRVLEDLAKRLGVAAFEKGESIPVFRPG